MNWRRLRWAAPWTRRHKRQKAGTRCINRRRADLKMSAAAVDDESCQDNEKHNCGGDRPPVIFAPPWVGPPAVVTARRTTSVFKV